MQDYFFDLADHLTSLLRGDEVYTSSFAAEDSDFVRFNRSLVRQAGTVTQRYLDIDLIDGRRHASGNVSLSGDLEADRARVAALLPALREKLPHLPEDPYLLYATDGESTERLHDNRLPDSAATVAAVLDAGRGRDLVGLYAAGGTHAGFANSLGQRNWFSSYSYNFDWSFYREGDKAVKSRYAGFVWDGAEFERKVGAAAEELEILSRPPHAIKPGRYRVYLAPAALYDILGLVSWGGFGLKDHRTKRTPLLKMIEKGARLHPAVSIAENTRGGVAPNFQEAGFIKPDRVVLIDKGAFRDCLVSPRSAGEYGVPTNGASGREAPRSLEMGAGDIPAGEALRRLDTGVYINNVWYLNYSDRSSCRITGMTRFATFWVENGAVQSPLSVTRFDETLYSILGENLAGLTAEREFIMDSTTYHARSTGSGRVPGALVENFTFTL